MINNRQNGRRRGRGGPQLRGAGNAPDRGNRIDNRARGNASQLHEKYRNLARDAQTQGDRVMTEYYLQFADHYFRVLSESRQRFEEQNQHRRQREGGDYDAGGYDVAGDQDGEDGFEGERVSRAEQQDYRPDRQPRSQASGEGQVREGGDAPDEGDDRRRRRGGRREESGAGERERIEVDRLPPAFAGEPAASGGADEDGEPAEPTPRRRRRPKSDDSSVAA